VKTQVLFRSVAVVLLLCAGLVSSAVAQLKLPEYTRHTLDNGVTLVLMPKRDVPLVTLLAQVKGGGESEAANLAGLADITNDLLLRGTSNRSAEQIAEEIDFLGASISTTSDSAANAVSLEVLSKDVQQGVEILADLIKAPVFPEDEVAKELARALDNAKSAKDNPRSALSSYSPRFFFGDAHPYGRVADEDSIARIQRQHILDYHQRAYCGANLSVIVVGDFDPAALRVALTKAFSDVKRGEAYSWVKTGPVSRPGAHRLLLVDDPQATQTYFQIMQPGISGTSEDRVPMMLVNTLFGGRFTSMLMDALRVDAGLTYGATSIMQMRRLPGSLAINTFTANETTEQAIDLSVELLQRLRKDGLNEEQLASAKAYVKGTMPTSTVETNDQLASRLASFEITGLDRSDIDTLFARIDAVTVDDARRVIDRYYQTEGLTFVLVGQRAAIGELAKKYAEKPVIVDLRARGIRVSE
jgi:zinc protease